MINLEIRAALLANLADLNAGDHIVVACSGGADSVALLRAAIHVGRERDLVVGAIIIDHQLQDGSSEVASNASVQAIELGAEPVVLIPVDVATGAGSGGLEAAARHARREAFELYATNNNAKAVLLGHTQDDQAETVLLGLARGSGARSLSGMRDIDGLYRRPLLGVSRQLVRSTVSDLEVHEDPHNTDVRFSRVRVRETVLPLLESELGPGVTSALARTADMLRDDADALDELCETAMTDIVDELAVLPAAIRTRVIRKLAIDAECNQNDLSREHVLAIDALITRWHGQGPINLPGNVDVTRSHGKLMFNKAIKE